MGSYNGLGGFKCSRITLTVLNILYIIVGLVLISLAAGGYALSHIADMRIMGGLIACGVFLLIIAIAGLVGTALHHQVTLFFYMSILFLLFLVQFAIACACLAVTENTAIKSAWEYSPANLHWEIQQQFNCCGGANTNESTLASDQVFFCSNNTNKKLIPSCCSASSVQAACCTGNWTHDVDPCPCDPCWSVLKDTVRKTLDAAGGVGLFFSFTEVIGVWIAFRYRNQKNPYVNPNQFL